MKKFIGITSMIVVSALIWSYVAAGGAMSQAVTTDAKMIAPDRVQSPQITVNYIIDEEATKKALSQNTSLLQVTCNTQAVLRALWFTQNTSKMLSIGLQEGEYEYTFDFRNCSLYGNKKDANRSNQKSVTEQKALEFANAFIKSAYLKDKVYSQLGKPMIVWRNSGGMGMPYIKWAERVNAMTNQSPELTGIDIDDTDPISVEREYTTFSILFPYMINGILVYNQYGNQAGITVEINSDGVMSFNAQLLLFRGARRTSEKVEAESVIKYIKNGGNSPFYGQAKEIVFAKPQRVFVLFDLWRNNQNERYISSGIRFASDVRLDQWQQQNYNMILSDYKIGNMNMNMY